jgi:hypothetical protein
VLDQKGIIASGKTAELKKISQNQWYTYHFSRAKKGRRLGG